MVALWPTLEPQPDGRGCRSHVAIALVATRGLAGDGPWAECKRRSAQALPTDAPAVAAAWRCDPVASRWCPETERSTMRAARFEIARFPALLATLILFLGTSPAAAQSAPAPRRPMRPSSSSCRPSWSSTPRRFRRSGRRSRSTRATSSRCRPRRSSNQHLLDLSDLLYRNRRLRQHQRQPGQPLAERPHLPRLPGLAAGRQPDRSVDVPGRHALQRRVRRDDQLGPDSPVGHRGDRHHPRLQSDLRAQHPRRRARRAHQARPRLPGVKLEASGGSFGRWNVNGEYGGFRGPFDWYLDFNALNEDGLARALAERRCTSSSPRSDTGRTAPTSRLSLRVRQQRPHRQWPGAGELAGAGPQGRVHVPRRDQEPDAPRATCAAAAG